VTVLLLAVLLLAVLLRAVRVGLDELLEGGPAGLAVFAGDGRLRVVQGGELTGGQAAFGFEPEVAQIRPTGQYA
jgi:hypothetical protein